MDQFNLDWTKEVMGVKKSSEKMVAISFRALSAEMLDTLLYDQECMF